MTSSTECTVSVCRDCCCGTVHKHPDVDHDAQLERLRDGIRGHGRVVVSQCLLACERSNVVVVSPSRRGRLHDGRPVWFREVLTDEAIGAIARFVCAGGPGCAPLPPELADLVTQRPKVASGILIGGLDR